MKTYKVISGLFAGFMLVSAIPTAVTAAPIKITDSIQSSLDKTVADLDSTQANQINSLYLELLTLQKQEQDLNAKIKALHTNNKESLTVIGIQIKQTDEAKLDQLEAGMTLARERYKSLFSHYSSLNKQIDTARLINNKELGSLLRLQANLLKIPVKLARMDIEAKKDAWQAAKDSAANTMKKIRGTLDDMDPVNEQIKVKQSAIKTIGTSVAPVWDTFKQGLKKGDSKTVLDTLTSLVSLSHQMNGEKREILNLETQISDILSIANAQTQ